MLRVAGSELISQGMVMMERIEQCHLESKWIAGSPAPPAALSMMVMLEEMGGLMMEGEPTMEEMLIGLAML